MDIDQGTLADLLASSYGAVTAAVSADASGRLVLRTRCQGWIVRDVLYHQLLDARRALRTYVSPARGEPDVDDVTYWNDFSPAADEIGASRHAQFVRAVASIYRDEMLVWEWRETSEAASRAADVCSHPLVTTQGHVMTAAAFTATLLVEATVHYLDLTLEMNDVVPPKPEGLQLVRRVAEGLLGGQLPVDDLDWSPASLALKATGREALTVSDRAVLGQLADRFPVFG